MVVDLARVKTRVMVAAACRCDNPLEIAAEVQKKYKLLPSLYAERDLCLKQEQYAEYTRAAFKIRLIQSEITDLIEKSA